METQTDNNADERALTDEHENNGRITEGYSDGSIETAGVNDQDDSVFERAGESDTSVLGAGGAAGGLSGDGERTDEYDAAVFGLGD